MEEEVRKAKLASSRLQDMPLNDRNRLLSLYSSNLLKRKSDVIKANHLDEENAKSKVKTGEMKNSLLKRLVLTESKYKEMIEGIDTVIRLDDPLGICTLSTEIADHLCLYRITCPIGLICVIYEARPEAGVQIASLCLKSGNSLLLKGGSEAVNTNRSIYACLKEAIEQFNDEKLRETLKPSDPNNLEEEGNETRNGKIERSQNRNSLISPDILKLIEAREDIDILLKFDKYIDLIIPRGSNNLVRYVKSRTTVPVLGHSDGLCSIYLDNNLYITKRGSAYQQNCENNNSTCNGDNKTNSNIDSNEDHSDNNDNDYKNFVGDIFEDEEGSDEKYDEEMIQKALHIVVDSKTQYNTACNAVETLLIHEKIMSKFLPLLFSSLSEHSLFYYLDDPVYRFVESFYQTHDPKLTDNYNILENIQRTEEEHFHKEWLTNILTIKSVKSVYEAIDHINFYGSKHTDCIITKSKIKKKIFTNKVDSANVFINCSTRFADGFRYGFGAEVGISTSKIHARGPVGLEGLTIYKYILKGNGQTVSDTIAGKVKYTHKPISM